MSVHTRNEGVCRGSGTFSCVKYYNLLGFGRYTDKFGHYRKTLTSSYSMHMFNGYNQLSKCMPKTINFQLSNTNSGIPDFLEYLQSVSV